MTKLAVGRCYPAASIGSLARQRHKTFTMFSAHSNSNSAPIICGQVAYSACPGGARVTSEVSRTEELNSPGQAESSVPMRSAYKRLFRLYRAERFMVHRRGGRKRALGTRAPLAVPQWPNDSWSLDFVADQFVSSLWPPLTHPRRGRRLHARMPGAGGRHLDLRHPGLLGEVPPSFCPTAQARDDR